MIAEKSPLIGSSANAYGDENSRHITAAKLTGSSVTSPQHSSPSNAVSLGESGAPTSAKTISNLGSFALLINNLIGPGLLGFPRLFQQAGILPSIICICFIGVAATLSGSLFSDAIAAIPGNKNYTKNVDFSSAFRLIIGEDWYIIAETLFLVSCIVQAVAGIVDTAQSVDGFLGSFLLGRTYALQVTPTLALISWEPTKCKLETEMGMDSGLDDCTPFNEAGDFIISLGFVLTTLLFLPIGRGNIKETIGVQIIAFAFMVLLLGQFSFEFLSTGFPFHVPWVGSELSQLAGFVLFNYAFIITLPAWLTEKKEEVSVNKVVWGAGMLASTIYIGFGLMGSMTFSAIGGNALILLTSTKVHFLTRICAAVFGVTIIGSGVPVFCVIIRTALYHSQICSYPWALFCGSIAPYLFSWMLYQGQLLTVVVNWTGLVVNGMVAFLLPMFLVLKSIEARSLYVRRKAQRNNHDYEAVNNDCIPDGCEGQASRYNGGDVELTQRRDNRFVGTSAKNSVAVDATPNVPTGVSSVYKSAVAAITSLFTKKKTNTAVDLEDTNNDKRHSSSTSSSSIASTVVVGVTQSTRVTRANVQSTRNASIKSCLQEEQQEEESVESNFHPLPTFLEPYRKCMVLFMVGAFGIIIFITLVADIFMGDSSGV